MKSFTLRNDLAGRVRACTGDIPGRFVYVNAHDQRLVVVQDGAVETEFAASTSRFGIGNRQGSFMTPRGVHRITDKIGSGAAPGRIFRERTDTGEDWHGEAREDNLILSRVLRLEGLEDGVNRGPDIDSYERCIYIHGTDKECHVGTPLSHGCICLTNADVIKLFDQVEVGTIVIID